MDEVGIFTHSYDNSSRVVYNDKVFENIAPRVLYNTSVKVPKGDTFLHIKPKSRILKSDLFARHCTTVHQREQLHCDALRRHLSRQQHTEIQSQSHCMNKFKRQLAGYDKLRTTKDRSIVEADQNDEPTPSARESCKCKHSSSRANRMDE